MEGQIIGGDYNQIKVRQKSKVNFDMGELLVSDLGDVKVIYRITDLEFASQMSNQNLELISGLNLEKNISNNIIEEELRNYILATVQPMTLIKDDNPIVCKIMPSIFSPIRRIKKEDLNFMTKVNYYDSISFGNLRSGSHELDVKIKLDGKNVFSHHILIAATTGKGKSNLVKNLLLDSLDKSYVANLVLDPHNEYFGSVSLGLKDHPGASQFLQFYSNNKVNTNLAVNSLRINVRLIDPNHLRGVLSFSDPQWQAISLANSKFRDEWILSFFDGRFYEQFVDGKEGVKEDTYKVVRRKFTNLFGLSYSNTFHTKSIFCVEETEGNLFVSDVIENIKKSKTVVIDTSSLASKVEILIGSLIVSELFFHYRNCKMEGTLDSKPIVNVVLEEAPRVIGSEALKSGSNIFDTIAREGRKFKLGLTAITQLPSLIPKTILANMNTKIILGIENAAERNSIIDSAAHDLTRDGRTIASLDKGEALVSSNFSKFAIPVKIPFFDDEIRRIRTENKNINVHTNREVEKPKPVFGGMNMN